MLDLFEKDMDIVAALDDQPNDVGGLTAAQLKAKFDEGGKAIQDFLNDTLIPQLETLGVGRLIQSVGTTGLALRLGADGHLETSTNFLDWAPASVPGHAVCGGSGTPAAQRAVLKFPDGQVSDDGTATVVTGLKGADGISWYPSVSPQGVLTFTQSAAQTPPAAVNIRGPQGPAGADGSSFRILGRYDSLEALQTAHPSGEAGDAYAVGTASSNTVYLWSVDAAAWQDVGALQGPAGQSAYQAAVAAGYTGDAEAFGQSLAAVGGKADRAVPSAAGNLAALDAAGNLTDSGVPSASAASPAAEDVSYDDTSTGLGASDVQSAIGALFTSVSEGKALLAAAVTGRGGEAAAADTFAQLAAAVTALPSGGGAASMTGVAVTGGTYQLGDEDKYVLFRAQSKGAYLEVLYLVEEQYAVVNDSVQGVGSLTLQNAASGLTITDGGTNGLQIQNGTVQFTGESITVYRYA